LLRAFLLEEGEKMKEVYAPSGSQLLFFPMEEWRL